MDDEPLFPRGNRTTTTGGKVTKNNKRRRGGVGLHRKEEEEEEDENRGVKKKDVLFDTSQSKRTKKDKKNDKQHDNDDNDNDNDDDDDDDMDHDAKRRRRKVSNKKKRENDDDDDDDDVPLVSKRAGSQKLLSCSMPLGGGCVLESERLGPWIESLSFDRLIPKATMVLGLVRQVHKEYAIVALPNRLSAMMRGGGSRPLTQILTRNSIMSFVVTLKSNAGDARRLIQVSAEPSWVNRRNVLTLEWLQQFAHDENGPPPSWWTVRGRIASCQDKGLLIHVGISSLADWKFFVSFANVEGPYVVWDSAADEDAVPPPHDKDGTLLLNPGRLYDFTLHRVDALGRVVHLTLPRPRTLRRLVTRQLSSTTFSSMTLSQLRPGMLVQAQVEQVARNGLCVRFMDHFRGAVEEGQLGGYQVPTPPQGREITETTWFASLFRDTFSTVMARIIAVDTSSSNPMIRLSLVPHVLRLEPPSLAQLPPVLTVGAILERAQVMRCLPGKGAFLIWQPDDDKNGEQEDITAKTEEDSVLENAELQRHAVYRRASRAQCIFVSLPKALDPPVQDATSPHHKRQAGRAEQRHSLEVQFRKQFAVRTVISQVRLLTTPMTHAMDGAQSSGATAPSIVEAVALSWADVHPGQVFAQARIAAVRPSGALQLQLGRGMWGVVPAWHLETTATRHKVGGTLTVRCLERGDIDDDDSSTAAPQCLLTAKRGLLTSNVDNPLTQFVEPRWATGYLSRVTAEQGMTVSFYNHVYGHVSARQLANELGISNATENYRRGDVVTVRVLREVIPRPQAKLQDDDDKKKKKKEQGQLVEISMKVPDDDDDDDDDEDMKVEMDNKEESTTEASAIGLLKTGTILPPKSLKIVQLVASRVWQADEKKKKGGKSGLLPGYAVVTLKTKHLDTNKTNETLECKLPLDQILDVYQEHEAQDMDALARQVLVVGKKINQPAIVWKEAAGKGNAMPVLSLRPLWVQTALKQQETIDSSLSSIVLPDASTRLHVGAHVYGYCRRVDERWGAFVYFLDHVCGLIPKVRGGCQVPLYSTVLCRVVACDYKKDDKDEPEQARILLAPSKLADVTRRQKTKPTRGDDNNDDDDESMQEDSEEDGETKDKTRNDSSAKNRKEKKKEEKTRKTRDMVIDLKPGDAVQNVTVEKISFARAVVTFDAPHSKKAPSPKRWRGRIHMTLADSLDPELAAIRLPVGKRIKKSAKDSHNCKTRAQYHPFYQWKVGMTLPNVRVVSLVETERGSVVELTNRCAATTLENKGQTTPLALPLHVSLTQQVVAGTVVRGVVTRRAQKGLFVSLGPKVEGFVPVLELSAHVAVLNDWHRQFPIGGLLNCMVLQNDKDNKMLYLSPLAYQEAFPQKEEQLDKMQTTTTTTKKKKKKKKKKGEEALEDDDASKTKDVTTPATDQQAAAARIIVKSGKVKLPEPQPGDLVVGRICRSISSGRPLSLMVELRCGFMGRCDITELEEPDEWVNLPMGRLHLDSETNTITLDRAPVRDNHDDDDDEMVVNKIANDDPVDEDDDDDDDDAERDEYPDGHFVSCRVLSPGGPLKHRTVQVSLRSSRLEGDLDEDVLPSVGDVVPAYVAETTHKGCFVQLSRNVVGRVLLKELSDGFLPDPQASYPPGRLVVGRVKQVLHPPKTGQKVQPQVDLDMRESTLLEDGDKMTLDELEVGSKHRGIVTRIESYGVFVRLDNSNVSGLAHLSECSDDYIKNIARLYDPGDLVKALVIKVDKEKKQVGLSLKASHFQDDDDSDEDEDQDEDAQLVDSDDENFLAKMVAAAKKKKNKEKKAGVDDDDDDDDDSDDAIEVDDDDDDDDDVAIDEEEDDDDDDYDDDDDSIEVEDDEDEEEDDEDDDDNDMKPITRVGNAIDTDVGFDWDGSGLAASQPGKQRDADDSSDDSDDSDDDSDNERGKSDKRSSRKKKRDAEKRRKEQEISARESALADGTADANPETAADFERILAADPNSSEKWMRYMAYHLSLADMDSARKVANRAFDRIEFRQEGEKLNVWTALLTMELKYGSRKSFADTIERACQYNNPKQVHLRVCEMHKRDVEVAMAHASEEHGKKDPKTKEAIQRADAMFGKMCKKFKSKKTVWIAHLEYLLMLDRHKEAHDLLKKALTSLAEYKHIETMSKFAQLEFEHGSAERARTVFRALLDRYPKRLDLLFVFIDKEVKHGEVSAARELFEAVSKAPLGENKKGRFSDKQMKSLFKKWYRVEEEHGTDTSREHVKASARAFVERNTNESQA